MDFRPYAIFSCLFKDSGSLPDCKESLIAEYIHIICQSFRSNCWKHFLAYEGDIFFLTSLVCASDSMGSKKVGLYRDRGSFLDTADDAEHLQLVLNCQSVAAFDLHSSCAHGHDFIHTLH